MQSFVNRFKANAKLTTLAQSRMKAIDKIKERMTDAPIVDPSCRFEFPTPEKISPPLMKMDEAFIGYHAGTPILRNVNMLVDFDTRIALVGPNGAGKSTIVKALMGELEVQAGYRFLHQRVRVGVFTQHHVDAFDLRFSAIEQFMKKYPEIHRDLFRPHLGSFGISGELALRPMYLLSGGQKSRVSFAMITWDHPHILMLDEPTNHLDFDAINALIEALKLY